MYKFILFIYLIFFYPLESRSLTICTCSSKPSVLECGGKCDGIPSKKVSVSTVPKPINQPDGPISLIPSLDSNRNNNLDNDHNVEDIINMHEDMLNKHNEKRDGIE